MLGRSHFFLEAKLFFSVNVLFSDKYDELTAKGQISWGRIAYPTDLNELFEGIIVPFIYS